MRTYTRDGDAIEGEIPRLAPDPASPRTSPEALRQAATVPDPAASPMDRSPRASPEPHEEGLQFSSADLLDSAPESDLRAEPDLEQEPKVVTPKAAGPAPTKPGKPVEPSQNRNSKVNRPNFDRVNTNRQASVKPSLTPAQVQKPATAAATAVLPKPAAPRKLGGGMLLLQRFGLPAVVIVVLVWFLRMRRLAAGKLAIA